MLTIILGACEDCQLGKHCSAYLIYENIGYRTWNLFAYYNSCLRLVAVQSCTTL